MRSLQLKQVVFHQPAEAGEITDVSYDRRLLTVVNQFNDHTQVAISRGLASLYQPRPGDYLVQYPQGHVQVMTAEDFTMKQVAGGANVH